MLDSKKLSIRLVRIFGQVKTAHPGLLDGSKEQKQEFRSLYLTEVVEQIPSLKSPANVAAKLAALKTAGFLTPPIPAGVRGRKVSASDKSDANATIVAEMAEVGLYPVYDGDSIVDWTDVAPPEVETVEVE